MLEDRVQAFRAFGRTNEREAWQRDREAAFRLLDEARLLRAYRLATLVLRDATEAEDATQEAIARAWQNWRSLREEDRFDAWFDRILVNVCRTRLRRAGRIRFVAIDDAFETAAADRSGEVLDRMALERAFTRLSPDQRIVLALRFSRDLTVEQIAERIGVAEGTVKSRLHYGLKALREALLEAEPERQEVRK